MVALISMETLGDTFALVTDDGARTSVFEYGSGVFKTTLPRVDTIRQYGGLIVVTNVDGVVSTGYPDGHGRWMFTALPLDPPAPITAWMWPFQYSAHVFLTPPGASYVHDAQYGTRLDGTFHNGLDFSRNTAGADIVCASAGTVFQVVANSASLGHYIDISHAENKRTRYAHMVLGSATVGVGDPVAMGQKLGVVGGSGGVSPHLHWETWTGVARENPRQFMIDRGYPET